MIVKFQMMNLRNAEYLQFLTDGCKLFLKHNMEQESMAVFYGELSDCIGEAETAMAAERANTKIREKGQADRYRDKLHSKLFNHVKAILYDEEDPRFDAAQRVMAVIKSMGNPTRLAENAESAMLTTLGNRLAPYRSDLEAIGALEHLDKLLEANRRFIELETECRGIASERALNAAPTMASVRKKADKCYRKIVNAINVFISLRGEEPYKALVAGVNTLVEKYDSLLSQRKGKDSAGNNQ